MSYEKLTDVIRALHRSTRNGKLTWEASTRPDSYETSFPSHSVSITHQHSPQGSNYSVQIRNSAGELVEEADDEDFGDVQFPAFTSLKEIFETARRQAKGVDQALDEILDELDNDFPF